MTSANIRAAIVQAEVAKDLQSGLALTHEKAMEAAAQGAKLIVFPETWIPGYPAWLDHCRDAALWDHAPVKEVFTRIAENSLAVPSPECRALSRLLASNLAIRPPRPNRAGRCKLASPA
jgi:predicted amidohydrolase